MMRALEFPAPSTDGLGVKRWQLHLDNATVKVFDRPRGCLSPDEARYMVRVDPLPGSGVDFACAFPRNMAGVRQWLGNRYRVDRVVLPAGSESTR